jgi:hypothetical protein
MPYIQQVSSIVAGFDLSTYVRMRLGLQVAYKS